MIEELPDDIENDIDDIEPVGEEADAQLYEHFRVVVDKGQAMMRVDKYLFERIVAQPYPEGCRRRFGKGQRETGEK